MKKILFPILALVLAVGVAIPMAIPMAIPAAALPDTMTVVSDDSGATVITKVYNKAGGVNSEVDLSGSPLTAVRAWEPDPYSTTYPIEPPEATDSTWDNGVNWFENTASVADWIWETHLAEGPASYDGADPLYDADAARYGRVVLFETTFNIPGNPTSATLHIAADNAYEFWVDGGSHTRSATAAGGAGWENSDLKQANVWTSGWQTVGAYNVVGDLQPGSNTLYVLAANEYFWGDDPPNFNNPTVGTWGQPGYHQWNPGAVIFQLDIEYEPISIELTPPDGYNLVGAEHCVMATIDPALEGVPITFVVTGANSAGPTVVDTEADGTAEFCYTGTNTGVDTITAFIDYDESTTVTGDEPYDTATKTWFSCIFVTGGGNIKEVTTNPNGKEIEKVIFTFGGNVGLFEDGTVHGQFQVVDHEGKESWHCHDNFDSLISWGDPTESPPAPVDHAQFIGTFTSNKGNSAYARVTIWDDQEPGRDYDWITVEVSLDGGTTWIPGFSGNPISGGNLQVHDQCKG